MSLAIVHTRALLGLHAPDVTVEVHISPGMPRVSIVGLAKTAVKESLDRVRSALLTAKFEFPARRITINLAPADLPKQGSHFDLAIAIGILAASKQIDASMLATSEFIGELALSGDIHLSHGALSFAMAAKRAARYLFIGTDQNINIIKDLHAFYANNLLSLCHHLNKHKKLMAVQYQMPCFKTNYADMKDVIGQFHAKRALEVAASGGHSMLFSGSPGVGKTMLAERLAGILPPLNQQELLQVAAIASLCRYPLTLGQRPFCNPHHSSSSIALIGGSMPPRPGEITRAHHGILFLDELPEFKRDALEALREPLESGSISLARGHHRQIYPARFQLIAAMNPCPCGHYGSQEQSCYCSQATIERYHHKLSAPFLDRIDLHLHLDRISIKKNMVATEDSATIKKRVIAARDKQLQRAGKINAFLTQAEIKQHCQLDKKAQQLFTHSIAKLCLSMRAQHRILRVARTIADLKQLTTLNSEILSEALSYRLPSRTTV